MNENTIRLLLGDRTNSSEPAEPTRPATEAQAMDLRHRLELLRAPSDLVIVKAFMAVGRLACVDTYDCLVGTLTDDGNTLDILPHQLSQLQRWEPEA